jgi:hypothetical protein
MNNVKNPNDPIVRIMNRAADRLYVTGYDGGDIGDPITVPPAVFHMKSDPPLQMDFLYLGTHDRTAARDYTCYMEHGKDGYRLIIGLYKGNGQRPEPLDEQYGYAGDFVDAEGCTSGSSL